MGIFHPESMGDLHVAFLAGKVFVGEKIMFQAVNDQLEPKSSIDHDVPFYHWWPHKGTTEWIQFEWDDKHELSSVKVYWFDDTGRGGCRSPGTGATATAAS